MRSSSIEVAGATGWLGFHNRIGKHIAGLYGPDGVDSSAQAQEDWLGIAIDRDHRPLLALLGALLQK